MRLVTAAQDRADEDLEAAFTFYAEELEDQGYPADIVSSACRRWARRETFWPALAELTGLCDQLVRDRRMLHGRLHGGPNLHRPTAEEIAERRQYAAGKAAREAAAAEWRAANPDAGPALTPMQAVRGEVLAEDQAAARKRLAELENARPLVETDPAVKAMVEAWAKELGVEEQPQPQPERSDGNG